MSVATPYPGYVGCSDSARELRQAIARAAVHRSTVLIQGESGTGKELVARLLHTGSNCAERPFVAVDCTAIPPTLFASQMFGHVRGAFSGADHDTLGCFRAAEGGTIFLDEISELPADLQVQLLRVIQERTVMPVGSHRAVPIDIRLLAATNRDLAAEVRAGRFRLDLYYRLNVVVLRTSPLGQRPEDIEPLCRHFLDKLAIEGVGSKTLTPAAVRIVQEQSWPGNVRQLQNVLERIAILSEGEEIGAAHVLAALTAGSERGAETEPTHFGAMAGPLTAEGQPSPETWPTLAEHERRLIEVTLEHTEFNQSATARLLDIDRRRLARKIHAYGIAMPQAAAVNSPAKCVSR